jgi:CheY-like chemotaxis protein
MPDSPLNPQGTGLRLFVVEDEYHVLLLVEDMLATLRCEVVEDASSLADALAQAQHCDVDAAVLDINLSGEKVYPVAAVLKRRNIPIVFVTGYGLSGVDPAWAHYPVVQKPFMLEQLAGAIAKATASPPPA